MASEEAGDGKVTLKTSRRPTIGIQHYQLRIDPDRYVSYALEFDNLGEEEAVDLRFNASLTFTNDPRAAGLVFPQPANQVEILEPGLHITLKRSGTAPMPEDMWEMLRRKELFLLLYGMVLYRGPRGSKDHFVKYCLRYDPETGGSEMIIHQYD